MTLRNLFSACLAMRLGARTRFRRVSRARRRKGLGTCDTCQHKFASLDTCHPCSASQGTLYMFIILLLLSRKKVYEIILPNQKEYTAT